MANTKSEKDKSKRKALKRASRKKAKSAKPKGPRAHARGETKRKMKKMSRGTAKR